MAEFHGEAVASSDPTKSAGDRAADGRPEARGLRGRPVEALARVPRDDFHRLASSSPGSRRARASLGWRWPADRRRRRVFRARIIAWSRRRLRRDRLRTLSQALRRAGAASARRASAEGNATQATREPQSAVVRRREGVAPAIGHQRVLGNPRFRERPRMRRRVRSSRRIHAERAERNTQSLFAPVQKPLDFRMLSLFRP